MTARELFQSEELLVDFDIASIVAYCHLFAGRPKSYCGIPRHEQPPHHAWGPGLGPIPKYCPKDGLRTCPRCIAALPQPDAREGL